MRAVMFDRFGEPDQVLELRDVPEPQPGPGQVRVRMLMSPVNPSDLMGIRGTHGIQAALPACPGHEGVGVVEAAGPGLLGRYLVGKRVAVVNHATGNWCEKTVVPDKQAIPVAKDLPDEQCAMFFVNPAAAYLMTCDVLKVERGAWLLQTAAGSTLGQMVIRLGRHCGFRTLNVVRRPEQIDELKRLGADEVVAFDPAWQPAGELADAVSRITAGAGVKHAIDPVAGATGSAVIGCLGPRGRMLCYGTLSPDPLSFSPRELMTRSATVQGFWLSRHMATLGLLRKLGVVKAITKLMRAGVLVSEVGETFPLERVVEAARTAEKTARGGKVLLKIGE